MSGFAAPPPPEGDIEFLDKDLPDELTHTQVARYIGIHRVTLLRMEQRGVIPKAKWKRLPQPHRVYSKEEAKELKEQVLKILAANAPSDVEFVDE